MFAQGDSLAVQLFIGAAALTALSVAMTQAGWTHKWFVRGMFGLAALLSLASMGWPYLEGRVPLISDKLETVASTRVAWFMIGIVPALVAGMLFSDGLRRQRIPKEKIFTWHHTLEAIETFARPSLLDILSRIQTRISQLTNESPVVDARISALQTAAICEDKQMREQYVGELIIELAKQKDIANRLDQSIGELNSCYEALQADIARKLQNGQLMAKGFRSPHTAAAPEIMIPTAEWRFLTMDYNADKALGPNVEYIAIMIGRQEN